MPFWKGWCSFNRNESRDNNGYSHTSKLYAVTRACGWIKRAREQADSQQWAIPRVKYLPLFMGDSYRGIHSAPPRGLHSDYMIFYPRKGGRCKALLAAAWGLSLPAWPTGNCWLRFTVHSSSHLLSLGVAVVPIPIFRWEDQRVLIHKNAFYISPSFSFISFLLSFFFSYFLKIWLKKPQQSTNKQTKSLLTCTLSGFAFYLSPLAIDGNPLPPPHQHLQHLLKCTTLKTNQPHSEMFPQGLQWTWQEASYLQRLTFQESNLLHYAYSSWWDMSCLMQCWIHQANRKQNQIVDNWRETLMVSVSGPSLSTPHNSTDIFERAKHIMSLHFTCQLKKGMEAAGKAFKAEN